MDETNQTQPEVHRVKRGRKGKGEANLNAATMYGGPAVLVNWEGTADPSVVPESWDVAIVEAVVEVIQPPVESPAQVLARRIWDGQGPDLNRDERIRRIAERLAEQGYTMEGIEL